MKREHDSLLNDWVRNQPLCMKEVADLLGVKYATMYKWLKQGYVPRKNAKAIAAIIKKPVHSLIYEYNYMRGLL